MSSSQAASSRVDAGVRTLAGLFSWRVGRTPAALAYREFDRAAGAWVDFSWTGVRERAQRFEAALTASGVARGARVASLLPNGIDAVCIDQAALARACVPVPMHALDNPASIANSSRRMPGERRWRRAGRPTASGDSRSRHRRSDAPSSFDVTSPVSRSSLD